jgi:N-acetylneuraminic acid mutarotase
MIRHILPLIFLALIGCKKENTSTSNSLLEHIKTEQLSAARTIDETVIFDNKVFFIGGLVERVDGNSICETIDIYDLKTGTWSSHALRQRRVNVSCFITADKLIILGGYTKADYSFTIDIYNSTTKTWTSENTDFALAGFSGLMIDNQLYMVNIDSYDLDDFYFMIYDTEKDAWTKENMPTQASKRSIIASNNKIYIAGGEYYNAATSKSIYCKTVDIYDIANKTWRTDSLSTARKDIANAQIGDKLFFIGGENASGNVNTIDIYNTQTNTWETSELPQTFDMSSLVNIGDYLFLMKNTLSEEETNAMLIYNKLTNSWNPGNWKTSRANRRLTVSDKYLVVGGGDFPKEKILDIYNRETNSWSTFEMNETEGLSGRSYKIVGDSLLFVAGGYKFYATNGYNSYSSKVDIYRLKQ